MSEEFYTFEDKTDYLNDPNELYNSNKDFTTLNAWKQCRDVRLFFYNKIIPMLPKDEKFNLEIQIRKASISITSNIAEVYGRFHFQEGIQFYRISRASLYELKDHLISCFDFKFINFELKEECESLIEKAKITLNGFINYVKSKTNE